jgi:molybdopterin-containing oxidoreductase family membrane subunit
MAEIEFKKIDGTSYGYYLICAIWLAVCLLGVYAYYLQWIHGHQVSGLSNQVPWGFGIAAVCYFIGASAGSLIVSALSGVFEKEEFKVFSRSAAFFAAAMIVAAMGAIFTDIGNPANSINFLLHFNPTSIFSWNAFLYSSYFVVCFVYLLAQFEEKKFLTRCIAVFAVGWAVLVHSGTGGILGFIYSNDFYHSSLTPPMFIISAIASGLGLLIPTYILTFKWTNREYDPNLLWTLAKIMGAMTILLIYCFAVEGFEKGYMPSSHEAFLRMIVSPETPVVWVYWFGQVGLMLLSLAILLSPYRRTEKAMFVASLLVAIAVFCERYILVVPGLSYPYEIFAGYEVVRPFHIVPYFPTWEEWAIVLGLLAGVYLAYCIGIKIFALLPEKAVNVKEVGKNE